MGRASVRTAIAAWFAPPNVTMLNTVYASRPKNLPATDFKLALNNGSGAVMVIHLPDDSEVRTAVGGATSGEKFNTHHVALEVMFQSVKVDGVAAQEDHDTLMDAIIARIRQDRTLGTGGTPIWQAGEGTAGIKVQLAEPDVGKQNVIINAVIHLDALEYVNA